MNPPWWFCCGWWSPWCVIDSLAHKYVPVRWRLRHLRWVCDKHDDKMMKAVYPGDEDQT